MHSLHLKHISSDCNVLNIKFIKSIKSNVIIFSFLHREIPLSFFSFHIGKFSGDNKKINSLFFSSRLIHKNHVCILTQLLLFFQYI